MQMGKWAYNFQSIALASSEIDLWFRIRRTLGEKSGSLSPIILRHAGYEVRRVGRWYTL